MAIHWFVHIYTRQVNDGSTGNIVSTGTHDFFKTQNLQQYNKTNLVSNYRHADIKKISDSSIVNKSQIKKMQMIIIMHLCTISFFFTLIFLKDFEE